MTRLATLLLLVTALSFAQRPTTDKLALLDGEYAAIAQKHINALKASIANNTSPKDEANTEIQQETTNINNLRARWAKTAYAANFEKGFQTELAAKPAPASKTPSPNPFLPPPPGPASAAPPFTLSSPVKFVLFFGGIWFCRRLWRGSSKAKQASAPVDLTAYSPTRTIQLNAAEQAQIAEAQKRFDAAAEQSARDTRQAQEQLKSLTAGTAALAARAAAMANSLTASAVADLNESATEYAAFLADREARQTVAMAPWSSPVWKTFSSTTNAGDLSMVRVGSFDETGLLPGEAGITSPWAKLLLSAEGPILVCGNSTTKPQALTAIQNIVLRAALGAPAEISFSLIDPAGLGSSFPMRSLLPRVRPSARTPADELADVAEDIRRVNVSVVGQAASFAALSAEQRAGEVFEIIVALDYPHAYERDPRALEFLARIAHSGPHAGRHLILEWDGTPTAADLARFEKSQLVDLNLLSDSCRIDPVPAPDVQRSLLNAAAAVRSRPTSGNWNALVRPQTYFGGSSASLVETPIGERLRFWFGEQGGRPCAHAMIAGQTGSGKSRLLHVLITGLAARYSPAELRFVLVDGKQGIEFEAYKSLPHAQVVCLRTSPAVARSVLDDFIAEMDDRYTRFQQQGVTKLEDYRRKTGAPMPRMLMIVDEYQQLIEGDSERGSQMLSRILEKGRAAGIHLILSSQTFEVRGFPSGAMTHIHLRAALSLSTDYVQTISVFGSEGKKLIRALTPPGQVVINDESGSDRDGANSRGAVALLDAECSLDRIIESIITAAPGAAPIVLNGNDAAVLSQNPFVRQWKSQPPDALTLQNTARQSVRDGGFGLSAWSAADSPLPLWLGRKFDVHGHLIAALRRASGHNMLVLGSDTGLRLLMLANAVAALRSMHSMEGANILLLDGLSEGQPGAGMLSAALGTLREAGANIERATPGSAAAALDRFSAAALQASPSPRLLILSEPEYFPELAAPTGYGPPPPGPSRTLKELLRNGPPVGAHTIVTASGIGALSSVLPNRDLSLFVHRVVQQSNEEESMTLFSSLAATRIMAQTDHHMAAMYVDTVQGVRASQLFKGYAASPDLYGDQSAAGLSAALYSLYGAASR